MGHEPEQCLLLQLLQVKEGVERGPLVKFPVLKLFGEGSRETGVKPWNPQGRGWGLGLRVYLRHKQERVVGCRGGHDLPLRGRE